jgi:hypothetical protein
MALIPLRSKTSLFISKVTLFLVLAGLVSGIEHFLLVWLHPTTAAEMGVRQFEPSNSAAEAVRSYEFTKNVGMTIRNVAIAVFGLGLFGTEAGNALNRLAGKGDQQ